MNNKKMSKIPQISLIGLIALLTYPSIASASTNFLGLPKMQINLFSILLPALLILGIILLVVGSVKYVVDLRRKSKTNLAKWLLFSGISLSISVVSLWYYVASVQPNLGIVESIGGIHDQPPAYPVPSHPILMADITQDPILLGASHNIFVGKVLAQTGTTESPAGIRTQYSVEVFSNIKGELSGLVVVEQEGGIKDGVLQTIEDSFPLLETGSTYVLATRFNPRIDGYTVLANENAGKLLSNDNSLDNKTLKDLIDNDKKIKTLEASYSDEILYNADIEHDNTRNAFKNLPPEAKAEAKARADEAKASLAAEKKNQ